MPSLASFPSHPHLRKIISIPPIKTMSFMGQAVFGWIYWLCTATCTNKSLVGTLLLVLAFYLFYPIFLSGSFSRTLLHVCLVLLLALGYFGTDSWNLWWALSPLIPLIMSPKDVTKKIAALRVDYAKDKSIKIGENRCRITTLQETSYKAYVFVNTGQENGKYKNSQDGKKKLIVKVLGTSDKIETLRQSS